MGSRVSSAMENQTPRGVRLTDLLLQSRRRFPVDHRNFTYGTACAEHSADTGRLNVFCESEIHISEYETCRHNAEVPSTLQETNGTPHRM